MTNNERIKLFEKHISWIGGKAVIIKSSGLQKARIQKYEYSARYSFGTNGYVDLWFGAILHVILGFSLVNIFSNLDIEPSVLFILAVIINLAIAAFIIARGKKEIEETLKIPKADRMLKNWIDQENREMMKLRIECEQYNQQELAKREIEKQEKEEQKRKEEIERKKRTPIANKDDRIKRIKKINKRMERLREQLIIEQFKIINGHNLIPQNEKIKQSQDIIYEIKACKGQEHLLKELNKFLNEGKKLKICPIPVPKNEKNRIYQLTIKDALMIISKGPILTYEQEQKRKESKQQLEIQKEKEQKQKLENERKLQLIRDEREFKKEIALIHAGQLNQLKQEDEVNEPYSGNNPRYKHWRKLMERMKSLEEIPEFEKDEDGIERHIISLIDSPAITISEIEKNREIIENHIGGQIYDIIQDKDIGSIIIEIAKSLTVPLYFLRDLPKTQNKTSLVVGRDIKQFYQVDLRKFPHLLIAGTSGSGKSALINAILLQVTENKMLPILFDLKGNEFAEFEEKGYIVISDLSSIKPQIEKIVDEMQVRYDKFNKVKVKDLEQYNKKTDTKLPRIFVVVDEFADITSQKNDNKDLVTGIISCISRLAAKGRAAGIHVLIGTQKPSQQSLGNADMRTNIPIRICGYMPEVSQSKLVLDNDKASTLLNGKAGQFIAQGVESTKDICIQTPFLGEGDVDFYKKLESLSNNPYMDYPLGGEDNSKKKDTQKSFFDDDEEVIF